MGGAIVILDLLGEEAPDPELAGRLEGEDHAAGGRAGDEVDERRPVVPADARGPELAQLAGGGRIREDRELLDVGVAVAPALELEVALAEARRSRRNSASVRCAIAARAAASMAGLIVVIR